jgi:tRNA U38,U39,U40 pseudouridine synthase TruA
LYGYLPFRQQQHEDDDHNNDNGDTTSSTHRGLNISNGQDAGRILMETIQEWQDEADGITDTEEINSYHKTASSSSSSLYDRINRSYGINGRNSQFLEQDQNTGAISEVMAVKLRPLRKDITVEHWLDQIQDRLEQKYQSVVVGVAPVRVLGRLHMPNPKFNAERDVTYRRMEYILPIDFLTWPINDQDFNSKITNLPIFSENHKHAIDHVNESAPIPDKDALTYMLQMKSFMKLLRSTVISLDVSDKGSVMEKKYHMKKRKQDKKKKRKPARDPSSENDANDNNHPQTNDLHNSIERQVNSQKLESRHVLKRKRFHNFSEKMMAHDYLAYRRLDRLYHRATLNLPSRAENLSSSDATVNTRFVVISMSGDIFLTGQVQRVIGVFLALINGVIDPQFVECVFDEDYLHLIPTPPAPLIGMVAAEAQYSNQEGKTKTVLSARVSDQYTLGWNQVSTLSRVKSWQEVVYNHIAYKWDLHSRDVKNGRLNAEKDWTENILLPWAENAKRQLDEYRLWKKIRSEQPNDDACNKDKFYDKIPDHGISTPDDKEDRVPFLFEKVLYCLVSAG